MMKLYSTNPPRFINQKIKYIIIRTTDVTKIEAILFHKFKRENNTHRE